MVLVPSLGLEPAVVQLQFVFLKGKVCYFQLVAIGKCLAGAGWCFNGRWAADEVAVMAV